MKPLFRCTGVTLLHQVKKLSGVFLNKLSFKAKATFSLQKMHLTGWWCRGCLYVTQNIIKGYMFLADDGWEMIVIVAAV